MTRRYPILLLLLLLASNPASGQTSQGNPGWGSWNGNKIGGSAGNVGVWDGKAIGTAAGNIGSWNGLVSLAIAGSLPKLDVDLLYTGNFSIANTLMTAAIGNNSMESPNCAPGNCAIWETPPAGKLVYVGANQSVCNNPGPIAVNGGSTHTAGSLNFNSIKYVNNNQFQYWVMDISTAFLDLTNQSMGYCLANSPNPGDLVLDISFLGDVYSGQVWVQLQTCDDGNIGFDLESSALDPNGHTTPCIEPGNGNFPGGSYLVSTNYNETSAGPGFYGTYSSGGIVIGSQYDVCNVTFTGGTGYVALTGTNSLTGAMVSGVATSAPWSAAPSTGTLSDGPASKGRPTCSGTIKISGAKLGGVATLSVHNATTGDLIGQQKIAVQYHVTPYLNTIGVGQGENYTPVSTFYFQNLIETWTGTPPVDMYGAW